MAKIYHDVTELVGRTPLVRLNRLDEGLPGNVAVKLEFYNPANSVKDRIGVSIIDAAEKSGQLRPGGTIVEGTSGNTGIALAWVGAARGYKVIIVWALLWWLSTRRERAARYALYVAAVVYGAVDVYHIINILR